MKDKIIYNAIVTPDGTKLVSRHRHDYRTHIDEIDGLEYMVDGGLDYMRRNMSSKHSYIDLSLTMSSPFEEQRERYEWGTRGKDGQQPLEFKILKHISNNHLEAMVEYLPEHDDFWQRKLFKRELDFRSMNNIFVEDYE